MTAADGSGVAGTGHGLRIGRVWLVPVIVLIVLSPFLFTSLAVKRPVWDELWFHIDAARAFGPGLPDLTTLRGYDSAVGPGFYVLFGNVGSLFGYRLFWLRLTVLLFAVANVLLLFRLATRLVPEDPLPVLLVVATYPDLLRLSGLFMSEQPALFFGLAGMLCYSRFQETRRPRLLAAALALTATAILFRQYFAFLPVGYAASELAESRRNVTKALVALTPVVVLVPLVVFWKGLAPTALQQRYHPGFTLTGASSVLVWSGAFLLPWLLLELDRRKWRVGAWMISALAGGLIVLISPELGLGPTRSVLAVFPGLLAPVAKVVLGTAGMLSLLLVGASVQDKDRRTVALAGLSMALLLCFGGPTVYERHFLPAYPLLLLALTRRASLAVALVWSLGVHVPIAVIHLFLLAYS
ncbi:MAG: glycosyltransferase family 39 protein [candidate division WOR-3 bacterium]|nr:MAG: glycosyltransferase family 39 protein [candidate division WOR-3 bacterium]